ncbi:MAG: undecaprenyldiphospho-muramoylpentapeptide beta-N-acetylglucosaminyltransferase [Gemmatimonadaceae bacterium]|nr:undecaprenyldiphospho-muramoylpentapeptide beta-N-acetylglucosaminyltransferase [Gloeobacterales cyanobacterium ES-bin-141]
MPQKSLLIAASGTGGHIFPALAVALELSEFEIHWLGVPDRLETTLVPAAYTLHTFPLQGLARKPGLQWIKSALQLWVAYRRTRLLIEQKRFAAVFTTGGYIAAPAVLAARSSGIPVILHESNALPGKVTRSLSRRTTCVGLGFEQAAQYLPGVPARWVGTPVRADFLVQPNPLGLSIPESARLIVMLGGSQGARALNQLVVECAEQWLARGWWVVHLSGQGEYETVRARAPNNPAYQIFPFWQQMGALLGRADLAISRCGAGTLSELLVTGTPSVLVPFPYAAEDHQRINGNVLVEAGAALQFNQSDLTAEVLGRTVAALLDSPETLQQMGARARALARPDAARQTAQMVREAIRGTR